MTSGNLTVTKSARAGRIFIQNADGEGGDFPRVRFEAAVGMTWAAFERSKWTPELAAKVTRFLTENF
jgi:hypothetical protein